MQEAPQAPRRLLRAATAGHAGRAVRESAVGGDGWAEALTDKLQSSHSRQQRVTVLPV